MLFGVKSGESPINKEPPEDESSEETEKYKRVTSQIEEITLPLLTIHLLSPKDWSNNFLAVLQRSSMQAVLVSLQNLEQKLPYYYDEYTSECVNMLDSDRLFEALVKFMAETLIPSRQFRYTLYKIIYKLIWFGGLSITSNKEIITKLLDGITSDLKMEIDAYSFQNTEMTEVIFI